MAAPSPTASAIGAVPASNLCGRSPQVVSSACTLRIMWPPSRNGSMRSSRSARPQRAPMPLGAHILWPGDREEVAADRLHVHRPMRGGLRRVDHDDRAVAVCPLGDPIGAVHRAERVRHEVERDDLQAPVPDELVEPVEHELALVGERDHPEVGARALGDVLPGNEVRVVLELGDEDDVTRAEVGEPPRIGDEVDALGRVANEDHLPRSRRVEKGAHLLARRLEALPSRAPRARRRRDGRSRTTSRRTPPSPRASAAASASSRRSRGRRAASRGTPARRSGSPCAACAHRAWPGRYGHVPIVAPLPTRQRDAAPDASPAARVRARKPASRTTATIRSGGCANVRKSSRAGAARDSRARAGRARRHCAAGT